MSKKINSQNGFTIIEILAAFVLIAIVIPVVMKGLSLSMAVAADSARKNHAVILAQNRLAEIVVDEDWQDSRLTGDFGQEHENYRWQMDSFDWIEPYVKQVDLKVFWESRGAERSVRLSTLVYTEDG